MIISDLEYQDIIHSPEEQEISGQGILSTFSIISFASGDYAAITLGTGAAFAWESP